MGRAANQRIWGKALHRIEGAPSDDKWPAPTFGSDFAHGVNLYRANVFSRMRHPVAKHTSTPVQIIVPTKDRYVTPALLEGLEEWASVVWRRPVEAGHWVIRIQPANVARWIGEVIDFVESGTEAPDLAACRIRHRKSLKRPAAKVQREFRDCHRITHRSTDSSSTSSL